MATARSCIAHVGRGARPGGNLLGAALFVYCRIQQLGTMSSRILSMREALYQALKACAPQCDRHHSGKHELLSCVYLTLR
jgi:hypothetical protein